MGDMSRMDRGCRFIAELNDDIVKASGLSAGDTLTIDSIGLGGVGGSEGIALWITVIDKNGKFHELRVDEEVFDPDDHSDDDTVERVASYLGIGFGDAAVADVKKRMESVDL
jgi:hypothetical protein